MRSKMTTQAEKQAKEGSLSLNKEAKRRRLDTDIDYTKCVICQGLDAKGLYNITSMEKLVLAMDARQDDTFKRLKHDSATGTWLTDKKPKWHSKCRNWYTNEKSYKLAEKKRLVSSDAEDLNQPGCSTSSQTSRSTRTATSTFDAKNTCVICNKRWMRGKQPTCRVSTENSQQNIIYKAKQLNREDILLRLTGKGHDMVANDISYHKPCMDAFKAHRVPTGKSTKQNLYDVAFQRLLRQLEIPLFHDMCGYLVKSLRNLYRAILRELGVKTADSYRSITLKLKLQKYYGNRISILDQTCGSGFICASTIPLGDALEKLRHLEAGKHEDDRHRTLRHAAKILREDCKQCKRQCQNEKSTEISFAAAARLIPDSLFNFTAMLLSETPPKLQESRRVLTNEATTEKALIASQQLLQHIASVPTPLAIATAYSVFNQTRSKSLIMLNHRLGQGISYERLQRQLTTQSANIMQQVAEDGVYIPEGMTHGATHVFAMDNLDWKKKTLGGGSFNATTAIIIENPVTANQSMREEGVTLSVLTSGSQKTLCDVPTAEFPVCYISSKDRQKSRSLSSIEDVENLATVCDNTAEIMLQVWRLGRIAPATQLLNVPSEELLPGFSAFCGRLLPQEDASKIGYLPLIPASPTDPCVLKEEMKRLVNTAQALGDRWTIITGDQATYELAVAIRDKHREEFSNVVLLLGGFHQAHNYVKAICKIIRDSGAEDLLVTAGLCLKGTANKMFGEKADYYQTMHAIRILSEAMWRMYWEAFESWVADKDTKQWQEGIENLVQKLLENNTATTEQLEMIRKAQPQLAILNNQMRDFRKYLDNYPTAVFWSNFLDMSDILHRFVYYQREGNWMGHLCESARMLPYLTAAGHFKYGQQSLPLYLSEMKKLPISAPEVHKALMRGAFVGRRATGAHNAVSPDMLLEQTYNADAKEQSGLDGIILSEAARTKWVYTKPVTASISAKLKSMLHLTTSNPHHESGPTRVARDAEMVLKVMATINTNPFSATMTALVNISTGQHADPVVQEHLTGVKELGLKALSCSISGDQKKTSIVKLKTFHTQNAKQKKSTGQGAKGKSDEVAALLRITQINASGGDVDVVNFIGKHECSKVPPSLFNEDGTMRAAGTKSSLVKILKEDTEVTICDLLPQGDWKTAVVVDAMHAIRRWSFKANETFGDIAVRYKEQLLKDVPAGTKIIHFCCDRYSEQRLKSAEQQHRYGQSRQAKVFEVSEQYKTPDPREFFSVSANKAALLNFLCETWSNSEQQNPALGSTCLYLGGGFNEETKTILITEGSATDIAVLESTQQEADTRVMLHTIYSVQNEGVDRVVIHGNDTDIIVICLYYAATILQNLPELWVRTAAETYLPIHQMAKALGPSKCRTLPFIHSLSGRDTTSYPFFTGKKTWLNRSYTTDIPELERFGEEGQNSYQITSELINQARQLVIAVYTNRSDAFEDCDLAKLRAHKFLNNRSTMLKLLPPTEDAYLLHLQRAALATIIDKTAHVAKPQLPPFVDYGWALEDGKLVPVQSTQPAWPQTITQAVACGCTKGCNRNCSCATKNVACYIGCRCQGSDTKCSRVKYTETFDSSDYDSDS